MSQSPVKARLDLLNKWVSDIPLKYLWVVQISDNVTNQTIRDVLGDGSGAGYERRNYDEWPIKIKSLSELSHNTFGFLLAQSATVPTESYQVSQVGIKNNAGFLPGYAGGPRSGYAGGEQKFSLSILETNYDAIDYFIKPWIIAASHKGLIEDGGPSLKCNIDLFLFTKDKRTYMSPNKSFPERNFELRKHYKFERCVPYQVDGDTLSYNDMSLNDITRNVDFTFERYYTSSTNLID